MVYYNLKNLDLNKTKLFHDIAKLVMSINDADRSRLVLKVSLIKISDSIGDSLLPKIELKQI
jgi:hypothetical protein